MMDEKNIVELLLEIKNEIKQLDSRVQSLEEGLGTVLRMTCKIDQFNEIYRDSIDKTRFPILSRQKFEKS